jgi:ribosome-interacting GTPase 1
MLRTIPKHKGTEHLQADIKSRIKQLSEELSGPRKGGTRGGPAYVVRREGAAQVSLIGPPNSGKSSLHVALTGSRAEVGPYPRSTHVPLPGMLPYEDIHFQLIDLPPISAEFFDTWYVGALQPADAALLVVDIADPSCADDVLAIIERLDERKVTLSPRWPSDMPAREPAEENDEDALDPFRVRLPTALVINKADTDLDVDDVRVLLELTGIEFPVLQTSVETRRGLDAIGAFLFERLEIVRVYTKTPGKPAEMKEPFTLFKGSTVHDVAALVHKDIAGRLAFARAWGCGVFDGQQVGPEHPLVDGDVVELHMR